MIGWLALTALAAACPDLSERVDAAWVAYDDAELAQARELLGAATQELACQDRMVPSDELRELFYLDTLVSLSQQDQPGAVYAILRAVAVDPDRPPPDDLGPQIADLHATWRARLADARATVVVSGGGAVFVDGVPMQHGEHRRLVEGEHLVQIDDGSAIRSQVVDIHGNWTIETGLEAPEGAALPLPVPEPEPVLPKPHRSRRAGPALIATGLSAAAVGGGAVLAGFLLEPRWRDAPYAGSYGGCAPTDDCWAAAREARIRQDATRIDALFGSGYGLLGVGAVLTGVGVAVAIPTEGGVRIGVSGRF